MMQPEIDSNPQHLHPLHSFIKHFIVYGGFEKTPNILTKTIHIPVGKLVVSLTMICIPTISHEFNGIMTSAHINS